MLSGKQSLYSIAAQVLIALTCVICATLLALQGSLDTSAVTAILGGALGIAGATGAVTAQAAAAAATTPATKVTTPEGVTVETNGATSAPPVDDAEH